MRELESGRLRLETDFFRKSNNLLLSREKRIRTFQVRGFHLLIMLLLFLLLGYTAFRLGHFVLTWEKLNVRTFRLVNLPESNRARVIEIVAGFRGNILAMKLSDLRRQFLALSEVSDVTVRRQLPATVEVDFSLRQPVFQVLEDDRYVILDETGAELRTSSAASARLITVIGTSRDHLAAIIAQRDEIVQIGDRLEYVAFCQPYGIGLKLRSGAEILYPGDNGWHRKIDQYLQVRRRLTNKRDSISYADLRIDDRIYLGFDNQGGNPHEE